MGLVDATWVGPSGYSLSDGTVLAYGETVCEVPDFEATDSDNWHPVPAADKGKGKSSDDGDN